MDELNLFFVKSLQYMELICIWMTILDVDNSSVWMFISIFFPLGGG